MKITTCPEHSGSTNGTHTRTFTPIQAFVRVKYSASAAFSLANATLDIVDVDTVYTVLARGGYRYGFNNMERDDELKGKGNSYDFGARLYDSRIGRFFSVDPLTAKYPFYSPYQFSGNRLIDMVELEGLEPAKPGTTLGQKSLNQEGNSGKVDEYTWSQETSNKQNWIKGAEYTGPSKVENANMAEHVYSTSKSNVKIGSEATNTDYKLMAKFNGGEGSSGFKAALYARDIDGIKFYSLAFAGTDDLIDGLDDASAGLGNTNGQLVLAKYLAQQVNSFVKKADNGNNLSFTGHSLGGGLAAIASFATGRKSTTFNAMGISTSAGLMNGLSTTNASKLITAYIIRGEVLNNAQPTKANGFKYMINGPAGNSAFGAHSISNFTKLWNKK